MIRTAIAATNTTARRIDENDNQKVDGSVSAAQPLSSSSSSMSAYGSVSAGSTSLNKP